MRQYILGLILVFLAVAPAPGAEFRFSGGTPRDKYLPQLITPVLAEAFRRVGHSFSAIYYPSLRSLKSSNSGKTDGELHRVYEFHRVSKGKYPNLVRIESELLKIASGIFTRNPNIVVNNLQDLTGHRIAFKRGRLRMTSLLEKLSGSTQVFPVSSDMAAIRMLAAGKVEFAIMEFNEGNAIIDHNPKYKNIFLARRFQELRIYAFINKRHVQIAPKIAAELEKMKSEGVFAEIMVRSIEKFKASLALDDK